MKTGERYRESTANETLLAVLSGRQMSRVPYSPMLTYWWETQGPAIRGMGEVAFLESIGATPLIRGHYPFGAGPYEEMFLFRVSYKDCDIKERVNGLDKIVEYASSRGSLFLGYRYVPQANTWFLVSHPVKTAEEFKLLAYMMDQIVLEADEERYREVAHRFGERALLVPLLCPESKTSFQSLLEKWVGTEQLAYALMDEAKAVEEALAAMSRVSNAAARIAAESSAPAFLTWEDTSTTNLSPAMFDTYILPEIKNWCDVLHQNGKRYIQHACGHLKALLPAIGGSGIDCLESVTPYPTGNVSMKEVNHTLPKNTCVIGGVDPTVLLNEGPAELRASIQNLLAEMRGRPFVLSNSDSCPPGVTVEKLILLGELAWGS